MSFEDKINGDIKTAMLAKDSKKLEVLRAIKNVVIILKTSPEGISDDAIMKSIQKEVKKRKEAADIFTQQSRADLAEVELYQAGVMEAYLPQQMNEGAIRVHLEKIISEMGVSSPADMGKVMGAAQKVFAGKADNKIVSQVVKELLSK